jgi:hypothetical protein
VTLDTINYLEIEGLTMKTATDTIAKLSRKPAAKRPHRKSEGKPMPIPDEKTARFLKAVKGLKGIL